MNPDANATNGLYCETLIERISKSNKTTATHTPSVISIKANTHFSDDDVSPSKWPPGPYALLMPNDGCPETVSHGWRRGYISFTWQEPHTVFSLNERDAPSCILNATERTKSSNGPSCMHDLTADNWPDAYSNLLGPFSRYAWRLNFCYKTDIGSPPNTTVWPEGDYSVFGDASDCPNGTYTS